MRISTVIFDWAGTAVDFGCMAPVEAFVSAFRKHGLEPTLDETRAPMGISFPFRPSGRPFPSHRSWWYLT